MPRVGQAHAARGTARNGADFALAVWAGRQAAEWAAAGRRVVVVSSDLAVGNVAAELSHAGVVDVSFVTAAMVRSGAWAGVYGRVR